MSTTDQILSEFIDAWNAGARPRVRDYLARAITEGRTNKEATRMLKRYLARHLYRLLNTPGTITATSLAGT